MDPENVSGGANRKNPAKPIRAILLGPSARRLRPAKRQSAIARGDAEPASHFAATEQLLLRTAGVPKPPPEKEISLEHEYETRHESVRQRKRQDDRRSRKPTGAYKERGHRCQAEGHGVLENQEGRTAVTTVIGRGLQAREVGLQILRQRRSRAVVQEETRCAMPRLLQEALRFGRAGQEGQTHSAGKSHEVVLRRETNRIGARVGG